MIGLLVLFPSTLVAMFWTMLGVPAFIDAFRNPNPIHPYNALFLGAILIAGWFGLSTMWRLYYHFETNEGSISSRWYWAGLVVGSIVSATLLVSMRGLWLPGYPLIGAAYFMYKLARA